MSEQDKNGKVSHEKKPKGCCHNCGFLVYIGMSLFSFFFMLAVAVVSGAYSGQLDHINYVSKVKEFAGRDAWINALEYKVRGRGTRFTFSFSLSVDVNMTLVLREFALLSHVITKKYRQNTTSPLLRKLRIILTVFCQPPIHYYSKDVQNNREHNHSQSLTNVTVIKLRSCYF